MNQELLEKRVCFEAVVKSESGKSIFDEDAILSDDNLKDFVPPAGRATRAATVLQSLGCRIHHEGTYSVSGDAPRERWRRSGFGVRFNTGRHGNGQKA